MTRWRPWGWGSPRLLVVLLGLYYACLGLAVLEPDGVYSGDIGVQYVQARALVANGFRSLAIDYPGEFLDPERRFFPIRPPFVMHAEGEVQAIFPPAQTLLQAAAVAVAGYHGLILLSIAAGVGILHCARQLMPAAEQHRVLIALGLAGPLWFYATSGWQHATGMAVGTAGFLASMRGRGRAAALTAGLWVGAGATLRDEVILLAPGIAAAIWFRWRALRPLLLMGAGCAAALAVAAGIEVWWFERPAAAHLRHAVHMLQSAIGATDAPNIDVPVLRPMTIRERYETVVWYWLFGYGNDAVIAAYVGGLIAALALRWRLRSSAPLAAWLAAVTGLAALDLWELVTAPKWLAGLHRVAPYLVFAILPLPFAADGRTPGPANSRAPEPAAPQTSEPAEGRHVMLLFRVAPIALAAYLIIAFAGVDTTGGKGLGPRLLLPLLPILTVAAIAKIAMFTASVRPSDRWTGAAGLVLVAMSLVVHVYGTTVAYVQRNREDAQLVRNVASARERIVVVDDPFTAQLLFPLYYRKIILLADSPDASQALAAMMAAERVPSAVLVSRQSEASIDLTALTLRRREHHGRMYITYWTR